MGKEMTVMSGLPWLALYNLVYVLPLILITLLVAYGISPERADSMRAEYKRPLRMVIGIILVALGVAILLGWMG
jgi:cytochrome c biogenesis protein CcdA